MVVTGSITSLNTRLLQPCFMVVTTLNCNLVTTLLHPCNKVVISVWELPLTEIQTDPLCRNSESDALNLKGLQVGWDSGLLNLAFSMGQYIYTHQATPRPVFQPFISWAYLYLRRNPFPHLVCLYVHSRLIIRKTTHQRDENEAATLQKKD